MMKIRAPKTTPNGDAVKTLIPGLIIALLIMLVAEPLQRRAQAFGVTDNSEQFCSPPFDPNQGD